MLLEWSVLRVSCASPIASSAVDGNDELRAAVPAAVNGPALPCPDDKVGAGIQQEVGVDIRGGVGPARLYRR